MSEAIRRCVDQHLDAEQGAPTRAQRVREALQVAGTHEDPEGATDVAREHPRIVQQIEAIMKEARTEPRPQVEPQLPPGKKFQ